MKHLIFILLACVCVSCKTHVRYFPVESTKIEYRDNYTRDSIVSYDSIIIREKLDSVIIERYKYLYRDKIVRDSVFKTDTIRVPYPVEVIKEVNVLKWWQKWLVIIGVFSIIAMGGIWLRLFKINK